MDIESKRYRVKGAGLARVANIHDKQTGQVVIVSNVPDHSRLSLMSESFFDSQCATALQEGQWPS
jgi:hypothetical protein